MKTQHVLNKKVLDLTVLLMCLYLWFPRLVVKVSFTHRSRVWPPLAVPVLLHHQS